MSVCRCNPDKGPLPLETINRVYTQIGSDFVTITEPPHTYHPPQIHGPMRLYVLAGSVRVRLNQDEWPQPGEPRDHTIHTLEVGDELVMSQGELNEMLVGKQGLEYVLATDPGDLGMRLPTRALNASLA